MLDRAMTALALLGAEWVLWLLLILSVISVTVMIERLVFYFRQKLDLNALRVDLGHRLDQGEVETTRSWLENQDNMETQVLAVGLKHLSLGPAAVREMMGAELMSQKARYEARLVFLGTLGNNAPFIGLLGTVLGIIKAFKDLSLSDPSAAAGGASAVMAGISEALVATAVGLAVALPAVVAFNFFKAKTKAFVSSTDGLQRVLTARLHLLCEKEEE
jgi:biopolymer transport protein ExbB/TolQ